MAPRLVPKWSRSIRTPASARSARSTPTGNYVILGLRPSTYRVTAEGQTQEADVAGRPDGDRRLRAAAAAGAGGASLSPAAARRSRLKRRPSLRTSRRRRSRTFRRTQRNFLSFAALAPGITVTTARCAAVAGGRSRRRHVNVLLDGMSFKNPINHGGVFGQNFGDFGNPFPQIAIQEYPVQTQNFGAETRTMAGSPCSARSPRLAATSSTARPLSNGSRKTVRRPSRHFTRTGRSTTTTASNLAAISAARSFPAS